MTTIDPSKEQEFLRQAREYYDIAITADREDMQLAKEDLEFFSLNQWPESIKNLRKGRPCLVMDRLGEKIDIVQGSQKENKFEIIVRPTDDGAQQEIAEIQAGIIRNIETVSDAEYAYNQAFTSAAVCGRGFFRIITDWVDDESFDQHVLIEPIANQFSAHYDPAAKKYTKEDGRFWFIDELITRDEFERRYPGKTPADFETAKDTAPQWVLKDRVRIAEYFVKERVKKTLYAYRSEKAEIITDEVYEEFEVVRKREVMTTKIRWFVIDGTQILEEKEWPGRYFPIVPVWGKEINNNGKVIHAGIIRRAKDAQRTYNYWWSSLTETVALAPKSPYMATARQIGEYQNMWDRQYTTNMPYLLYTPDPQVPGGMPKREAPPPIPTGQVNILAMASDQIKAATGIYDASLGARSNETSGRAIIARKQSGDVANYEYIDNLARSIKYAGKVICDLIPKIYDTARTLRIVKPDGKSDYARVNQETQDEKTGEPKTIDLSAGRYDTVVDVGPKYATKRLEAADTMMKFMQAVPNTAPIISDLVASNMDWPGATEIAKRLRKLLMAQTPGIVEPTKEEIAEQQRQQGTPGNAPQGPDPREIAMQADLKKTVAESVEAEEQAKIAKIKADQERVKLAKMEAELNRMATEAGASVMPEPGGR